MLSDGTAGGKTLDFDMLFKINMVLFQVNLALSAVSLAQASFKIHCVSPSTVVGGALQAIDAGKALGRAFQIYYDSVFWICDYATGDPAKLDEFRKFTVKNINETLDYMKALWNGCKFDALCGVASIGKLETLSKVLDIKTYALDTTDTLTSHLAPEQNYDDLDWLDEFSKNPYQIMLDQIMSLIGRFVH